MEAAGRAVRVIVRRPHAYAFPEARSRGLIPGLVVLTPNGDLAGGVALPSEGAVDILVGLLNATAVPAK